jgi:hypothetical protein
MASGFPTSLDVLTDGIAGNYLNNPDHTTIHNDENDAIEKMQVKIGVDGSAVNTTIDYKLSGVTTGNKAVSTAATTISTDHVTEQTSTHGIALDDGGILAKDVTLTADHIDEITAAHGVVIDGVQLKDGGALAITGGTNAFTITNGSASIDVAAASILNLDANLTVESTSIINQDVTSDGSPTFNQVNSTTEHTTTLNVDHIAEHTAAHTIVFDNDLATDHILEKTAAHGVTLDAGGILAKDVTVTVDHLSEITAAHGVVIDGVQLKDGGALAIVGGTNTFNIANGTATLDVAAGSAVDINANLTVESASLVNQDLTSDASPTFTQVNSTTEHTTTLGVDHIGEHTGSHTIVFDNDIAVDHILEKTAAHGVSIDGITLKDNLSTSGITPVDGWVATGTFTYASATSITVASGAAAIYSKGDKLKLTQARSQAYTNDPAAGSNIELNMADTSAFNVGNKVWVVSSAGSEFAYVTVVHTNTHITVDYLALNHTTTGRLVYIGDGTTGVKYFYVVGVADTTLTITGGTMYTLENAAISSPCYSKVENPLGFPDWFRFTPTFGAGGSMTFTNVVTQYYDTIFKVCGWACIFSINIIGTTGGSASPTITATLPIAPNETHALVWAEVGASVTDTSRISGVMYIVYPNVLTFQRYDGANWGIGTNRVISGQLIYPI